MPLLDDYNIRCPYCGQAIDITVDSSIPDQQYVEDCQVCCRPILLRVSIDEDQNPTIEAAREND